MIIIYRRWFWGTALGVFGAVLLLAGAAWLVDPIEIWEAPVIRGFNHIKPKQGNFLDVVKPFQVQRHKPEIVYIGTSRIYVGFRPEENGYNMGGSSLSLPDIRSCVKFIYSQHIPKRIFIGLDLFQFGNQFYNFKTKGFSDERLAILRQGGVAWFGEVWETNLAMTRYLWETVRSSYKNWDKEIEWERGWDVKRGTRTDVDKEMYYVTLYSYYGTYTNFEYAPDALICLQDILKDAEEHGVEVVLFFNPVAVDLLAIQSICGREEVFQSIKKDVAALHPVYDFAWTSPLALNREKHWLDGSHYHCAVGEQMKASMTETIDGAICRLLTPDTVDAQLREEGKQYEEWAKENREYLKALSEVAPQRIPEAALKQYLGF